MYLKRGDDMRDLVIVKKQNKDIVRKKTGNMEKHMGDHGCRAASLTLRCSPLIGPEVTSRLVCCLQLLHSAALAFNTCWYVI